MVNFLNKSRNKEKSIDFNKISLDKRLEKFNSIMTFASSVVREFDESQRFMEDKGLKEVVHPLIDVIRVLGKNLQSEYLSYLLFSQKENRYPDINYWEVMFDIERPLTNDDRWFFDLKVQLEVEREVYLSKDLILPWPWDRTRLINSISRIGKGRLNGEWKQDFKNHNVQLWLPLGITWVGGGNHSIATGIIQGEGTIKPKYIFDISPVYEHIYCDGLYYRRKHDDSIISEVTNIEFAAIFEIGRIMIKNHISF